MYGDYTEELVPEPNTEADVRAYYLLERSDPTVFDTLSPKQIQAITNTWDHIEDLAMPQIEDIELRTEMYMLLCDTTVRIIDGTTTLDTLLERKRETSERTAAYIKADVCVKIAEFALELLRTGAFITPRRQNHYPKNNPYHA